MLEGAASIAERSQGASTGVNTGGFSMPTITADFLVTVVSDRAGVESLLPRKKKRREDPRAMGVVEDGAMAGDGSRTTCARKEKRNISLQAAAGLSW